ILPEVPFTILTGTCKFLPQKIKERQKSGRSIFFLDQFGYSDVRMNTIHTIFRSLERAEVVLNFAIDGLLNYLHDASAELPNN
ncbi:MAG: hypothetical protein OXE94_04040, partial [Aestuariivita sp.]|nr:hypothetical protein [Aestuariivita sp.]